MKTKNTVTQRKLDALVRMWPTMATTAIAAKLKTNPSTVRSWAHQLRRRGVPLAMKSPSGSNVLATFAKNNKRGHNKSRGSSKKK